MKNISTQTRLGVIGYGERARHMVQLMCEQGDDVRLVAVADPRGDALRDRLRETHTDAQMPRFYDTADEMLGTEPLDGVVIGTRCSLHAAMAVKVLSRDIALYLEKPVATTMADLLALREAFAAARSPRIVVSFPLRMSRVVQLAKEIIDSGKIGDIEQVRAWCNVPYGNVYFQTWYRDENETHGLFLQKATHDFDYINYLLGANRPRRISAVTAKRVFTGNHPAGLRCEDCSEKRTCFESPYHPSRSEPLSMHESSESLCAFAVDTGNEDSGSALIEYDSGMHAVYSQNFYTRGQAARRGASFVGYHGTLELDWYPEAIKVYLHHENRVETHSFEGDSHHGGGDAVLAENFVAVIRGEAESVSPLENGLRNTLQCLKAKESAATRCFEEIEWA
ncbi:MAG: Gfo/Idh/MocA family oxidoreductase [Armatimonadetes bacterium]|nr:Gfo/Idh/MocA family oxidoreductase [Armatimonadota bacterium]